MHMAKEIIRPWEGDPNYQTANLKDPSDYSTNGEGQIAFPMADKRIGDPIYVELGSNVLRIGVASAVTEIESLTAEAPKVTMPMRYDGDDFEIGRSVTPSLDLDLTASPRHLALMAALNQFSIQDLSTVHPTIVHFSIEPWGFTRIEPARNS